jgi:hypothetical protein
MSSNAEIVSYKGNFNAQCFGIIFRPRFPPLPPPNNMLMLALTAVMRVYAREKEKLVGYSYAG